MGTVAIVGAGPGLGLSLAKVFGGQGFEVALIARTASTLDELVDDLADSGIAAAGYRADIMDRPSLVRAFRDIAANHEPVEVLEFSPAPRGPEAGMVLAGPLDVSVANVQPHLDFYVHGAITATGQVLPDMLERGSGTLLYTTGPGSVLPAPAMGNVGLACAALRNWVLNLHDALAGKGVYAAHVPLSLDADEADPDRIAPHYWDIHVSGEGGEHPLTASVLRGKRR
ncbi:short-chain dehydrogenase [Asanoa ishikariensis]|uniref:Short chain dehydrogenase n=1 Tax=Asanoa ishikariensis TaxID=137265 RepID=A0A1H3TYY4_9ACTN|nr:SDR family NAD(P)-dependent oxidoreductase [Asanoa ishikariensis]GIF67732.1 short-chain dehydrogenase [Asanoa ishikariensis]SDZ55446.1 short chain dehydrogenase [Asanoa ishikariensis]